jgi:hypothetical protein
LRLPVEKAGLKVKRKDRSPEQREMSFLKMFAREVEMLGDSMCSSLTIFILDNLDVRYFVVVTWISGTLAFKNCSWVGLWVK